MAIVLPKFPRRRTPTPRAIDSRPALNMRCCRPDGCYAPGESLVCTWQVENLQADALQGLEASILWSTEGKGDEDLAVHFFHRWSTARLIELDLSAPQRFSTRLPESPLSYNGMLFRIRWCARMRLFLANGSEMLAEQPLTVSLHRES